MSQYKYKITSNQNYGPDANKILVFGINPNEKFYVCYVLQKKVVIFEWHHGTSAELIDTTVKFLIEKIMNGYEVVDVVKTRSGISFLKNEIYIKYRNLLRENYGISSMYLDDEFKQFLIAALYDNKTQLKKTMENINDYLQSQLPF